MSLDDRFWYLILGVLIGYLLGRYTRKLDVIEKELHEVDEIVKEDHDKPRGEGGFMSMRVVRDAAVLVTVLVSFYAAFLTQGAANESAQTTKDVKANQVSLKKAQNTIESVVDCNQKYLAETISALNARTTYSGGQANANVELQKAQAAALRVIIGPPPPTAEATDAATRAYLKRLTEFLGISAAQAQQVLLNAYPTEEAFSTCVSNATQEK